MTTSLQNTYNRFKVSQGVRSATLAQPAGSPFRDETPGFAAKFDVAASTDPKDLQPAGSPFTEGEAALASYPASTDGTKTIDGQGYGMSPNGQASFTPDQIAAFEVASAAGTTANGVPMTGLHAIDPETRQPASALLVEAAARAGIPLPQASFPSGPAPAPIVPNDPAAPVPPLPNDPIRNTSELTGFKPAYEGQSLADFMAGRDTSAGNRDGSYVSNADALTPPPSGGSDGGGGNSNSPTRAGLRQTYQENADEISNSFYQRQDDKVVTHANALAVAMDDPSLVKTYGGENGIIDTAQEGKALQLGVHKQKLDGVTQSVAAISQEEGDLTGSYFNHLIDNSPMSKTLQGNVDEFLSTNPQSTRIEALQFVSSNPDLGLQGEVNGIFENANVRVRVDMDDKTSQLGSELLALSKQREEFNEMGIRLASEQGGAIPFDRGVAHTYTSPVDMSAYDKAADGMVPDLPVVTPTAPAANANPEGSRGGRALAWAGREAALAGAGSMQYVQDALTLPERIGEYFLNPDDLSWREAGKSAQKGLPNWGDNIEY